MFKSCASLRFSSKISSAFSAPSVPVGAFSVIVKIGCGTDGALHSTKNLPAHRHSNTFPQEGSSSNGSGWTVAIFGVICNKLAPCSPAQLQPSSRGPVIRVPHSPARGTWHVSSSCVLHLHFRAMILTQWRLSTSSQHQLAPAPAPNITFSPNSSHKLITWEPDIYLHGQRTLLIILKITFIATI